MIDGLLLEAAEGLDESGLARTGGEIWEWLQGEKEEVFQDILAEWTIAPGRGWRIAGERSICRAFRARSNGGIVDSWRRGSATSIARRIG